ncbi:MAG TPA: bifunctional phosphopantothenoylcysteine decarboxylase/phosphopantothenate--cysteine ligase CoaBC [Tenuifilaceae bacterium]|jgi:phosphopantothenoylcysteine decarboxylase/phosphopantothenate--cysteine ligase|nr:bifunctional phosphopantothenoylcysteine decarboxylase/phosphopantothenate--cysteine ligase CoaBC [Bacteroidales bacterium]HNT40863.1 bifunctional phosphopantothenoylcysteine decarboxylase/phosphopantothenate--cysteine ligase CoaBC [Tenuifilaceae bacterium]MBP8643628.1 bifunctional phosphopantothenoylcysteine decarboxylase/phosphopantothenate--cysteine ligase CoaBC [Bacteroidales bacterium]NLI88287.1 bifunctional phosphopantothenoylcysteine decarboxylase/phosphopantothenate--cysteine ligase C
MRLAGKHIILGVTGSIAAYKAAILTRLLIKEGAEVKVIMTPHAKEFITPLTLATLSKNPILVDFFNPENGGWNSHVDLGLWADLFLIAPASANTMAKMASGVADNLLLTTYLSARCPVMLAPAMDMDMYSHPATQKNIQILKSYGNIFVEAATGELASGLSGKGRMEEPENILQHVVNLFLAANRFNGYKVLITSGPTYEPIDPVRFIGNYSSGKMGTAIATAIAQQGAQVTFITGPAAVEPQHPSVKIVRVKTASEMLEQAKNEFDSCQVAILAAAVADFAPANTSTDKIKRGKENLDLQLEPTTDIAETLGKMKRQNQIIVGFALETHNEVENAIDKLTRKNLDIIVLNSLNDAGAGFGHNTNKITLIDRNGKQKSFELKPKSEVAQDIANAIIDLLQQAK